MKNPHRWTFAALVLVFAGVLLPGCASTPSATSAINEHALFPDDARPTISPEFTLPVVLNGRVLAAAKGADYKTLGELAAANPEQAPGIAVAAFVAVFPDATMGTACVQAVAAAVPANAQAIITAIMTVLPTTPTEIVPAIPTNS